VVIALPYVAAGLSKIRNGGLFWWESVNMRDRLYAISLDPMEFDWKLSLSLAPAPDILFSLLGIAAVLSELTFGLVLVSRTARQILPIMMILMHIGIIFLQNILFFDLILLQLVFFDFVKIRRAIESRLTGSHGPIQVLYDGFSPVCRRVVRLIACFDLFNQLKFLDFRQPHLANYNRIHMLKVTTEYLEKQMYVISRGKVYSGVYAYRYIALSIPVFWLLAPYLFLPGISSLGNLAYKYVASNCFNFGRRDTQSQLEPPKEDKSIIMIPGQNPY